MGLLYVVEHGLHIPERAGFSSWTFSLSITSAWWMARIIRGSMKHQDETQCGGGALLSPPRREMGRIVKFAMELGRFNSEELTSFCHCTSVEEFVDSLFIRSVLSIGS